MNARIIALLPPIVALLIPPIAEAAPANSCSIAKSVYRDGEKKGFQLVFSPPPPNTPYHATAVINHPQQGQIYRFVVSQSSGYGSVWLNDPSRKDSNPENRLWITFFDRSLKSATPTWLGEEKQSPKYAVIAELGSYDYSRRRGNPNPPLMGDFMWVFDRCQ